MDNLAAALLIYAIGVWIGRWTKDTAPIEYRILVVLADEPVTASE